MNYPTLNLDLLTQQIEWAEASERLQNLVVKDGDTRFRGWGIWIQTVYAHDNACGTAYCQAGQAAVQAGWRMRYDWSGDATTCERDDEVRSISEVAQEALGLTEEEADAYFLGFNDIFDLKRYVNEFAETRGLPKVYDGDGERIKDRV